MRKGYIRQGSCQNTNRSTNCDLWRFARTIYWFDLLVGFRWSTLSQPNAVSRRLCRSRKVFNRGLIVNSTTGHSWFRWWVCYSPTRFSTRPMCIFCEEITNANRSTIRTVSMKNVVDVVRNQSMMHFKMHSINCHYVRQSRIESYACMAALAMESTVGQRLKNST